MRLLFIALASCCLTAAAASAQPVGAAPFVRGQTTPADVESRLGTPERIEIGPEGAMTLFYTARAWRHVDVQVAADRPEAAEPSLVAVRFGPDLTYQGFSVPYTPSRAQLAAN